MLFSKGIRVQHNFWLDWIPPYLITTTQYRHACCHYLQGFFSKKYTGDYVTIIFPFLYRAELDIYIFFCNFLHNINRCHMNEYVLRRFAYGFVFSIPVCVRTRVRGFIKYITWSNRNNCSRSEFLISSNSYQGTDTYNFSTQCLQHQCWIPLSSSYLTTCWSFTFSSKACDKKCSIAHSVRLNQSIWLFCA